MPATLANPFPLTRNVGVLAFGGGRTGRKHKKEKEPYVSKNPFRILKLLKQFHLIG
jgi:hypothetical protein